MRVRVITESHTCHSPDFAVLWSLEPNQVFSNGCCTEKPQERTS
jgi:hypothetical protein